MKTQEVELLKFAKVVQQRLEQEEININNDKACSRKEINENAFKQQEQQIPENAKEPHIEAAKRNSCLTRTHMGELSESMHRIHRTSNPQNLMQGNNHQSELSELVKRYKS